jgi:hypothetical protein
MLPSAFSGRVPGLAYAIVATGVAATLTSVGIFNLTFGAMLFFVTRLFIISRGSAVWAGPATEAKDEVMGRFLGSGVA